jgi:hypothetical protein
MDAAAAAPARRCYRGASRPDTIDLVHRLSPIVACLLGCAGTLVAGAPPALADWHQPLGGGPRGLRPVTLSPDDAGGVLVRWVTLEGQVYSPWPQVGQADHAGAPPPGWSGFAFVPTSYAADLDVAPDGAGGGIVATAEEGDIRAYHFRADGGPDPDWPSSRIAVCGAPGIQGAPRAVSDGAGGAYIAWQDPRDGTATAYLTRVGANGSIAPGWPADGRQVGPWPPEGDGVPWLRPDGNGGAIVGLLGSDVRLFRFAADGAVAAGWPEAGRLVATSATAPDRPGLAVASDAGTYLAWTEGGGGPLPLRPAPVRLLRVTPAGAPDPRWPEGGLALSSGADSLSNPAVAPDAAGGVYVVWGALSTSGARSLRAARVLGDGSLAPGWGPDGIDLLGSGAAFALDQSIREWEDPAVFAAGPDGSGGLFVAWDDRGVPGTQQVHVSRFLATGVRHPGWLESGHPIPASPNQGCVRAIVGDGAGGAFVAWRSIISPPFGTAMLSLVVPDVVIGVAPAPGHSALALATEGGNPIRGAVVLTCTLPAEGRGCLELYDVSGRRLRSRMLDGPAGGRRVVLAGAGELAPGVVFARLAQGRDQRWLRMVVTR